MRPILAWALASLCFFLPAAGCAQEHKESALPPWGLALENEEPPTGRIRGLLRRLREDRADDEEHAARFWVRPELLVGWIRADRTPPLATKGEATDPRPGALDSPFTRVVYGGNIDYEDRRGFRIDLGGAVSDDGRLTMEASYFFLDGRQPRFTAQSEGQPVLARPFFDVLTGQPDSSLTTFPELVQGGLEVVNDSFLQGFELNGSAGTEDHPHVRLHGLAGLRYLNLREGLTVRESSTVTRPGHPLEGMVIAVQDLFRTTNDFYGGQVGVRTDLHFRRLTAELFGKIALGMMDQTTATQGGTSLAGRPIPGGLLALASNSGSFSRTRFGYVPEAGVRLQGKVCRHLLVHCGYSFLFLGQVARPGDLVDLGINPRLVPVSTTFGAGGGPVRPAPRFEETDFWAHLFQFGVTVQY